MIEAHLYPAFLDLTDRDCLVIGRGRVADEKAEGLRASGAKVTLIDPDSFEEGDVEGRFLIVAATEDRESDEAIFDAADSRGIFVNTPDVPDLCSFILPAVVRRGPLSIAISTSGASPALAIRVKKEIAETYGPAHEKLARMLDELRPWARENLPTYEQRRIFFESIVNGSPDPLALLASGDEGAVVQIFEAAKERATSS